MLYTDCFMKKFLFLSLLAFFLCSSYGNAQRCFFEIDKMNEKTKQKVLLTRAEHINRTNPARHYFSFALSHADNEEKLCIQLTNGGPSVSMSEGQSLTLTLSGGETIVMRAKELYKTLDVPAFGGGRQHRLSTFFDVTRDDLIRIQNEGLSEIRMETSAMTFITKVTEADNKKVANAINCFLSKL